MEPLAAAVPAELVDEAVDVCTDLTWLDRCTCCTGRHVHEFFVDPGHVLPDDLLDAARACPTRRQEVIWAYARGYSSGYFGGLSPSQRQRYPLPDALAAIARGEL